MSFIKEYIAAIIAGGSSQTESGVAVKSVDGVTPDKNGNVKINAAKKTTVNNLTTTVNNVAQKTETLESYFETIEKTVETIEEKTFVYDSYTEGIEDFFANGQLEKFNTLSELESVSQVKLYKVCDINLTDSEVSSMWKDGKLRFVGEVGAYGTNGYGGTSYSVEGFSFFDRSGVESVWVATHPGGDYNPPLEIQLHASYKQAALYTSFNPGVYDSNVYMSRLEIAYDSATTKTTSEQKMKQNMLPETLTIESPNGSKWRIAVSDAGKLTAESLN